MSGTYAQDGVNVERGDDFSAFAGSICKGTWKNSQYVHVHDWGKGHFRGPKSVSFKGLPPDTQIDLAADGVGTKTIVTSEALTHLQAGYDIIAMPCADITRWGGLPLLFSNVLDVSTLGRRGSDTYRRFGELILSLRAAADSQGIVLYRGETAELGPCVSSENPDAVTLYNWAGFAVGAYHPKLMITGEKLEAGQVVMALKEYGFRGNGMSSVRGALRAAFGKGYDGKWWLNPYAKPWIRKAAAPCTLYDKFLATANGWFSQNFEPQVRVTCVSHISGGGIVGKFAEDALFPLGLSAELTDLFDPPEVMLKCAQWRGVAEEECYRVWHGGQGALVVLDEREAGKLHALGRSMGISAQLCGRILPSEGAPKLFIKSKFSGGRLEYTKVP